MEEGACHAWIVQLCQLQLLPMLPLRTHYCSCGSADSILSRPAISADMLAEQPQCFLSYWVSPFDLSKIAAVLSCPVVVHCCLRPVFRVDIQPKSWYFYVIEAHKIWHFDELSQIWHTMSVPWLALRRRTTDSEILGDFTRVQVDIIFFQAYCLPFEASSSMWALRQSKAFGLSSESLFPRPCFWNGALADSRFDHWSFDRPEICDGVGQGCLRNESFDLATR